MGVIFLKIPNLVLSTLILFVSNIVARGFGFIYKIFLSNAMGETALGVYQMIFNFLMICIALTTTGIPTALSCLVAKKHALKDKNEVNIFFISALYFAFLIAFIISLTVSFSSNYISLRLLHDENLNLFVLAICPAIVIITISNILRSYFYGIKKVVIPAIGQIIEQVNKMLFVFLLIMFMKDDAMVCYIALLGISIGEASNVLFMTIALYRENSLYNKFTIRLRDFYTASTSTFMMAIPITCNRMSSIVLQSISSMIIPSRLMLSGMTHLQAMGTYGIIAGMVTPFVYVPFTIGSALVVNLIPSLSQEIALNKYFSAIKQIKFALLLTIGVGISCSLFYYFAGEELCNLVFHNKSAGTYLKAMCLAPLFLSLNQTLSSILHAIRKEVISSVNTIVGMVIQVIALYFLLPIPTLNIYAYVYVITATSIFTTICHSIVLIRALKNLNPYN